MRPLLLLIGLVLLGSPALAADRATEEAKQHNQTGKKFFNLGQFEEAAQHYQRAYQAKPNPAFLFNLGQCYKRMAGAANLEKAIFFFRGYLANDPFTPFQKEVDEEIAKLERRLAEARRPKPFYKRWWFWTIVGVAVTGATVGTALALQPEDEKPFIGSARPGSGETGTP